MRFLTFFSKLIVCSLVIFSNITLAQSPWEEHGKLEVSVNKHLIQHEDDTPFLWIGDTGWGMIQQLTREEVDFYLDSRQKMGFTVIQTVAHWSPHGGGLDRSPDNAPNAYGHRPFTGEESSPNTAEPLTVSGGSASEPNDYWDHLDYVLEAVKKRNMFVALLPCWGSELITGNGEYTVEEARAYGTFLGNRYADEPHIIWVMGGDTKAYFSGYDKYQIFSEYDCRNIYRSMAEGIARGVTGKKVRWDEPNPAWDEVLMTYHPNGDYPYGSAQWFHEDQWLDANGVEVWKEVQDVFRAMLDDYQRTNPVKPSLFLEGSYEYGTYRHECGWVTPLMVRQQFYQTFFAGGAGHTYGAGPIWAMRGNDGDYNCGYTWKQALDFPGAVQIATIAKKFLLENDWQDWVPNGNVLSSFSRDESRKVAVTTRSGDQAFVYFSNNSYARVNNTLQKEAEAYWFYPRNGQVVTAKKYTVNETRVEAPPKKWEDAILVLKAIE